MSDNSSRSSPALDAARRGRRRLAAALGAALLLAEAGIAAVSLFRPRVDDYYASFYITGARICWLPPGRAAVAAAGLRVPHLRIAALPAQQACWLLAAGWSNVESWGVWSAARVTEIDLPAWPGGRRLTLSVIGYSPRNRQSVKIWVNGIPAGDVFVPTGVPSRFTVAVPPTIGDVRIKLRIKHPSSPSGADLRRLGIGLIALDWS